MTPIERQILENQLDIMQRLELTEKSNWKLTLNLLYKKDKEDCCEMPEFAKDKNGERK